MGIFNITSKRSNNEPPSGQLVDFRVSNNNIHIDTEVLRISELQITQIQWQGNI